MSNIIPSAYEKMIFEFRGVKVMIDADLASLYGTETKKLKQAVKRNIKRFPPDFMFELSKEEKNIVVDSDSRLNNLKYSAINPMVFTEQGVAMLSSVIHNETAILVNIEIMRAFSRYRMLLLENQDLRKEIMEIDEKLDVAFKYLLEKIDELTPQYTDRRYIGYNRNDG